MTTKSLKKIAIKQYDGYEFKKQVSFSRYWRGFKDHFQTIPKSHRGKYVSEMLKEVGIDK